MTPQDKQQLLQVRALIKEKHYKEARAILVTMPQNATAQEWLGKLDEVLRRNAESARQAATEVKAVQAVESRRSSSGGLLISVLLLIVIIGAAFVGLRVLNQEDTRATRFENQTLAVNYPTGWQEDSTANVSYCQETFAGCFLFLRSEGAGMAFSELPLAENFAPEDFWEAYVVSNPAVESVSTQMMTVGGESAWVQEYRLAGVYALRVTLPRESGVILISAWAGSEAVFNQNRGAIMGILGNTTLKPVSA